MWEPPTGMKQKRLKSKSIDCLETDESDESEDDKLLESAGFGF